MVLTVSEYRILKGAEDSYVPPTILKDVVDAAIVKDLYEKNLIDLNQSANFVITEKGKQELKKAEESYIEEPRYKG